ncbi:MAG: hypothetical protein J6Y84_03110 [Bacteroidaceae bacterium]|nr:hypothetical protein [Bacteroidaceae bacterium]
MRRLRSFVSFAMLLLLSACSESYQEFCTLYPVTYSFDITYAPFNQVASMGQFLRIRPRPADASVTVTSPSGKETKVPLSETERRSFSFGLAGLIVGQPYFNDGSTYYAYDLGCPACDKASARLGVDEQGHATCPLCDNVYDLNNGGVIVTGSGRPLYRYKVTQSSVSTLFVHN